MTTLAQTRDTQADFTMVGAAHNAACQQALREFVMDSLATVKLFYSLLASGDSSAALQLLDPEIEWTEAERTPYFAGTMIGPDAVIAGLFAPLARDFDNFITTPSDFVTERDRWFLSGDTRGFVKATAA
jgi:ketosteroid isomerase-like protein